MDNFWSTNNELYRLAIFHVVMLKTYEKNYTYLSLLPSYLAALRVSSKKELLIPVGRFFSLVLITYWRAAEKWKNYFASPEYVHYCLFTETHLSEVFKIVLECVNKYLRFIIT